MNNTAPKMPDNPNSRNTQMEEIFIFILLISINYTEGSPLFHFRFPKDLHQLHDGIPIADGHGFISR